MCVSDIKLEESGIQCSLHRIVSCDINNNDM